MAKRAKRKVPDRIRRSPKQQRALESVEAILAATTQILSAKGSGGLNTNHIAERAGVSIGTLYQYFPNKGEIIVELARRQLASDRTAVLGEIQRAAETGGELDRAAIRQAIRLYEKQPKVRRLIMENLIALGRLEEVSGPVRDVGLMLTSREAATSGPTTDWPLRVFVGTRAIESAIRAAAYEDNPYFGTQGFEDALVVIARALIPELGGSAAK